GGNVNVEQQQQDNGQQGGQQDNGNGPIVIRSIQMAPGQFQSNQIQQGQPNQYRNNGGNQYQNGGQFNNGQNQFNNRGFGRNRGDRGNYGGQNNFGGQQQQRFNTTTGDPNMFMPPTTNGTNGTDGLIFNFRGVPIEQVLNYLSD